MRLAQEIAAASAVWIVDHGLDYAAARRKALEHLGLEGRRGVEVPDNLALEDAVREHIALFCADTQPGELLALRRLALSWMERLAPFQPHLGGAVWRGVATRDSPLLIDLYTDDPTAPEIELHNQGVRLETGERPGRGREPVPVIGIEALCPELQERVPLEISVWPSDDLRGALQADARGRSWRGNRAALHKLIEESSSRG